MDVRLAARFDAGKRTLHVRVAETQGVDPAIFKVKKLDKSNHYYAGVCDAADLRDLPVAPNDQARAGDLLRSAEVVLSAEGEAEAFEAVGRIRLAVKQLCRSLSSREGATLWSGWVNGSS
jgi:hypothetical protein